MMRIFRSKTRRGLTIAEIIIALTIIASVALTAVIVLSGAYLTLFKEKALTASVLATQKESELIIKAQREDDTGFVVYSDCFIDHHDVNLKQLKMERDERTFYSLVSRPLPLSEVLPRVTKVSAEFINSGKVISNDFFYGLSTTKIKGEFEMDTGLQDDFMVNTVYWYVSKPGFYVPSSIETVEYSQGRIPYFPSDYELIAHTGDNPQSDFSLTKYPGRHIVMEVAPATLRGVIGTKAHAKSLYVHALTYTNNIYAHYDASCLDLTSAYYSAEDKRVKVWNDISANKRDGKISSVGTEKVLLVQNPSDAGSFTGHDLKFQGQAKITIPTPDAASAATFFIVRKYDASDADAGKNTLYNSGASALQGVEPKKTIKAGNYVVYVYLLDSWSNQVYVSPSLKEDGVLDEVIIYTGSLFDATNELNADGAIVKEYLEKKYSPKEALEIAQIKEVKDLELTVKGHTDFIEPSEANALLVDGRIVPVSVEWDAAQLKDAKEKIKAGNSTTKPLLLVVEGHVAKELTKRFRMKITVPVDDDIIAKLEKRVINVDTRGKLRVEVRTKDANKKAQITLSNDEVVKLSTNEIDAGKLQVVDITPKKPGKVDITITYQSISRKLRLIVTQSEPPMTNMSLWLDAMDESTVAFNSAGKVLKWKNKATTDPKTDFQSVAASAPSYQSTNETAYMHFPRNTYLRADKLYRDIVFKKRYENSDMTVYFVGELGDKTTFHSLFSQKHSDTSLALKNIPSYQIMVDASKSPGSPKQHPRVAQAIFDKTQVLIVEDDGNNDDEGEEEDDDDKVELDKKFVLVSSVQHREEIEGSIPVHFFEFKIGVQQGDDEVDTEEDTVRVSNTELHSADLEGFYIGQSQAGATLNGKVYEVLIYKGIHDETTTEKVLKYLKQKWYD